MSSTYKLPGIARRATRYVRGRVREVLRSAAQFDALRRLRRPRQGKCHGLPGELIVSLTSYPARFGTLHLTLGCLLDQSVKADRTILWLADQEADQLPTAVRKLEQRGLDIRTFDDLRSFKKLVPALEALPNAYIATADDDLYFPPDWLEELVSGDPEDRSIRAWRTHRLKFGPGAIEPYMRWHLDVHDVNARRPSVDLLPTSGSGALFPPHCLHSRVTDRSTFQRLCPTGDDLWFYWCARMAGTPIRKVGRKMTLITWPGTQEQTLWADNMTGGNDRMIRALEQELGSPL